MKKWLVSIPFAFLLLAFTPCKNKKVMVKIQLTSTTSHCGGARPTPEIEQALITPRPLTNKTIFIREGKLNDTDAKIVAEGTSDEEGNLQVKLEPGTYCVIDANKKDVTFYNQLLKTYTKESDYYTAIDSACLKKWLAQPEYVFEVKKGENKTYIFNFHKGCSWEKVPCANYKGPYPP